MNLEIFELPLEVESLLDNFEHPIRLKKHLRIVYSTAVKILSELKKEFPSFNVDDELILFGAATHDIGKIKITSELKDYGHKHELIGKEILLKAGFTESQSRFTITHANWKEIDSTIEDLIVTLADKVWKGKRIDELEEMLTHKLSNILDESHWDIFVKLDDILSKIIVGADERINWQDS